MSKKYDIRELTLQECRIDNREWMKLYLNNNYDELTVKMIEILSALSDSKNCFLQIDKQTYIFINTLCKNIGFYLTQESYTIEDEGLISRLMLVNRTIANIFEISSFGSTDCFVKILKEAPNSLVKLLVLYNAKCSVEVLYKELYKQESLENIVSNWYGVFMNDNHPITRELQTKMSKHLLHVPKKINITLTSSTGYFNCTYIDNILDRNYKRSFNSSMQSLIGIDIKNKPKKKKPQIAIVSSRWKSSSAVYRSLFPYIEALSKHFELTLLALGDDNAKDIDESIFKKIILIKREKQTGTINVSEISVNDYSLVLYADIGMDTESRFLSNVRIAPLQATMYGHPVSTFGSTIDFFIGGEDTERADLAEENYDEKLVLIKGIGAIPIKNNYIPSSVNTFDEKKIVFLGSFYKINSQILDALEAINTQSNEVSGINPKFMFVPGSAIIRNQSFLTTSRFLKTKLGEETEVNRPMPNNDYMDKLNSSTICLDSYPFGGFNSIMDALHVGKPVVTYEGTKAYNRLASAVMRRLGLDELIASSQEEYIAIATRLLSDKEFYNQVVNHIAQLDFDALLRIREDELEDFVKKIKMIISGEIKK
ncbi:hypothetical protein M947_07920 [Sulfurimonas hongkongensis]|uniref:O-GlcNAc transferase C-terminal domain-containing protein n=1 Tax=Sulfurimonas hongkongensis TaxID=1172190 RepID=T0KPN7_9BACT|nr:hypothetical protein [Sulfurimonas hongkongensis]EQB39079.1 hypothetical protein M947_07920 [Sulfurimonas hongkongensis]